VRSKSNNSLDGSTNIFENEVAYALLCFAKGRHFFQTNLSVIFRTLHNEFNSFLFTLAVSRTISFVFAMEVAKKIACFAPTESRFTAALFALYRLMFGVSETKSIIFVIDFFHFGFCVARTTRGTNWLSRSIPLVNAQCSINV
jgi:hypothetical protein